MAEESIRNQIKRIKISREFDKAITSKKEFIKFQIFEVADKLQILENKILEELKNLKI